MTLHTVPRALSALTVAIGVTVLAGCATSATGELGENQKILATCPDGMPVDSFTLIDGSGSNLSESITAEHLATIESVARRTAICGGHLTVRAFSAGSAATTLIYDAEIMMSGATDNARLRRVPGHVEQIMRDVEAAYPTAVASLPEGGSDISGVYRLLGEQAAQLPGMRLEATISTDGLNNIGVSLDQTITKEDATALADTVSVPKLPADTQITVVGLGRVAGAPLPSTFVEGLVVFYDRLCENTGAEQCLSVTDGR